MRPGGHIYFQLSWNNLYGYGLGEWDDVLLCYGSPCRFGDSIERNDFAPVSKLRAVLKRVATPAA